MSKKHKISIVDYPEEETVVGNFDMKIYGETSYENQMAVLSHYLHNHRKNINKEEQAEIIDAIRDFLFRKEMRQKVDISDWGDEQVLMAAEDPTQYDLFSVFFNVPFPAPETPSSRSLTFLPVSVGLG